MTQLYATSYAINTSSEGNYQGDVAHSKWAGNQPIIAVNLSTIIHLTLSQLFLKKNKNFLFWNGTLSLVESLQMVAKRASYWNWQYVHINCS